MAKVGWGWAGSTSLGARQTATWATDFQKGSALSLQKAPGSRGPRG